MILAIRPVAYAQATVPSTTAEVACYLCICWIMIHLCGELAFVFSAKEPPQAPKAWCDAIFSSACVQLLNDFATVAFQAVFSKSICALSMFTCVPARGDIMGVAAMLPRGAVEED